MSSDLSQYDTRTTAKDEGGIVAEVDFDGVTIQDVLDVLSDYYSYVEYIEGNNKVELKQKVTDDGKVVDVFWNITVASVKTVEYTLRLVTLPDGVSWHETDHGPFKKNRGGWFLKEKEGGGVHATYVVLIEFNVWVPGFIKDFLIGKGLPKTLEAFKKRVESRKKN